MNLFSIIAAASIGLAVCFALWRAFKAIKNLGREEVISENIRDHNEFLERVNQNVNEAMAEREAQMDNVNSGGHSFIELPKDAPKYELRDRPSDD